MTATTVTYMPSHRAVEIFTTHSWQTHQTQTNHTLLFVCMCATEYKVTRCRLHMHRSRQFPSVFIELAHATHITSCNVAPMPLAILNQLWRYRPAFPFATREPFIRCKRVCGEWVFNKHTNNNDDEWRVWERHTSGEKKKQMKVVHISMWIFQNKTAKKKRMLHPILLK